ncbi:hypothetical protein [Sulfurimonas sp.]|uniref:tetratricopeptide repeat protein n=1 Tax=Sulfurimonas sp. TaxID=2022749 RepID=UPI002B46F844|nr:hypothetical protein [Sulfurimonas sp.]
MKKLFKIFVLLFIFASQVVFANSVADEAFDKSIVYHDKQDYMNELKWLKITFDEDETKEVAFNLGLVYENLKDYDNAINWYKKSFKMGSVDGGVKLGLLYDEKLKDYPNAIKWYKKAFEMGNLDGAYNLGCLYDVNKKDFKNAIIWYKKAAKKGHKKAINNLGEVYHDLKDNITASAYVLAGIVYGYDKQETFKYLNKTWKIDEPTMIKAYKLQQILDIPKHYIGDID